MKVYFDVSCLNRPFDNQGQERVRIESEAVLLILERCRAGSLSQVSSTMALVEISRSANLEQKRRVKELLPPLDGIVALSDAEFARAHVLQRLGFKPADALHIAAAEAAQADVFLTCDDRLARCAAREAPRLSVRVSNPVNFLRGDAP